MQATNPKTINTTDETIITNVSAEDYMKHYADHHYEWINGGITQSIQQMLGKD